jgi:Mor family transcriptional regulator
MQVGQYTIHTGSAAKKAAPKNNLSELESTFAKNMEKMKEVGPGVYRPNYLPIGPQPVTSLADLQIYGQFNGSSTV